MDMSVAYATPIFQHAHTILSFGPKQGMRSKMVVDHHNVSTMGSVSVGPGLIASEGQVRVVFSDKSSGKVGLKLDPMPSLSLKGTRRLSSRTSMAVQLSFARIGVKAGFIFKRGNVRFNVPVLLCGLSTQNAWTIFWSSLTPLLASALVQHIIKPREALRLEQSAKQAAARRIRYLEEARSNAAMQQKLMQHVHKEPHGLVILAARYGQNASKELQDEDLHRENVDVTIPLAFFSKVHKLFNSITRRMAG